MRVASTWDEAFKLLNDLGNFYADVKIGADKCIGVDIGRQFGTNIIMRLSLQMGRKLLSELQRRDCPLPQVTFIEQMPARILIGVDPEDKLMKGWR